MQITAIGAAISAYRPAATRQTAALETGTELPVAADAAQTKQLDFSNMRPSEQIEAVNALIRSGQMSLDESSSLLVLIPPGKTLAEIDSQPVDLFDQLRRQHSYNTATGNTAAAEYNMKALAALERLQGSMIGADFSV